MVLKLKQSDWMKKYIGFNSSNYPKDSKFFNPTNRKVLGKMKDEREGKMNDEFVELKSKMYWKYADGKESNIEKGVNIATEFDEFKDTLFNKKAMMHTMKRIQSKKHKLETYEINKISLPCFDDKRYVQDDSINALAYFHKDINSHRWKKVLINGHK